jgi:hypothetical protein
MGGKGVCDAAHHTGHTGDRLTVPLLRTRGYAVTPCLSTHSVMYHVCLITTQPVSSVPR